MSRRTKKILSVVLATAMVFTMNSIAFAAKTSGTAEDVIEAYEPIDGGKHGSDTIDPDQYAQVPNNWGINSDPATWSTSTRILSTSSCYYNGGNDDWTVYSPISYFFNPVSYHLVDGRIVVPKENSGEQDARKDDEDKVIYRVIPAGTDTFVLVRVSIERPGGGYARMASGSSSSEMLEKMCFGEQVDVIRWDGPEKKNRVTETINSRYNGDEPVIRYSGLKNVNWSWDKDKKEYVKKKGEKPVFNVDAVLIKRADGKNTLVKGLSVKDIKFKNNVNATVPEVYRGVRVDSLKDGSGTEYVNGYELTIKDGEIVSVKYVGPDFKAQLTKNENKNFKGQPSFTVTFDVKGDAKKYRKDVAKAQKQKIEGTKQTQTTFNFEIAQLNIGNWITDHASATIQVQVTGKDGDEIAEKLQTIIKNYVNAFKAAFKERFSFISDEAAEYLAEDCITGFNMVAYNETETEVTAKYEIKFNNAPMYVDKDIDSQQVSQNGAKADVQLFVKEDDVKNLKFGKNNKVSAKLTLTTSMQNIFADNGTKTENEDKVGTFTESSVYVKTSPKAGGKADVVLTSQTVSDSVFGDVPFAIAQGQNDLTGAVTMRKVTDAHGEEYVQYGHYKDENNYTVNSLK